MLQHNKSNINLSNGIFEIFLLPLMPVLSIFITTFKTLTYLAASNYPLKKPQNFQEQMGTDNWLVSACHN